MFFSQKVFEQYELLSKEHPECVLLLQVGSFMQVFNKDAKTVSKVTGLKLKMAGDIESPVITGGFPKSGIDKYVGQLVRAGHSIAIAFQNDKKERHIEETIKLSSISE